MGGNLITIFLFFSCFLCSLMHGQSLRIDDPRWLWMDAQIEEEFKEFEKTGITLEMLNGVLKKVPEITFGPNLIRLKIINGKVYGCGGFAKHLLDTICEIYSVPDVDLIVLEQDIIWNHWLLTGPVLATCKITGTTKKMIHFPVQVWLEWERDFITSVEKACEASPWESKAEKIFWRGYNTDGSYNNPNDWIKLRRGKLCYLSKQHPHLIDATFSGTHSWLVRENLQASFFQFFPKKIAPWEEYIQHKYLIDLDGCVASTPGCAWKLLSNCAVLKHDSVFTLWFYKCLIPWVHYIPVKEDLSDIFQKLQWAKDHDKEAKQIAENGRNFAHENLMPEHLYLYCYKVLLKYASMQRFTPSVMSN